MDNEVLIEGNICKSITGQEDENGNEINESVRPDYVVKKGDILYLSGSKEGFAKLSEWAGD